MIPSRLFEPRILRVPLATALVISAVLGAGTAWAQGQPRGPAHTPKLSEVERARRLAERDRYKQEANRQAQAGNLEETLNALGKELAIERDVLGEFHQDVVDSLNLLARFQEAGEDWAAARNSLTEVIRIRQSQPDRKDWRIADARRALADLNRREALNAVQQQRLEEADQQSLLAAEFYVQGKYAEGIGPGRKAMEIRGELLGQDHPDYAFSLNNLALLYRAKGDYVRAEPMLRQALALRKKTLGVDHPDYAQSLNNLADLYVNMGYHARAEPMYREALVIRKKALSVDHPDYAQSLSNLAGLYQVRGEYARAEPMYREALAITKKAVGVDHPNYATSLNNLAVLCQAMGDYARAEPMYREALDDPEEGVRHRSPRLRPIPQQPGHTVPGKGRLCPRRADAPRGGGDRQEGAEREPPRLCPIPQRPGRVLPGHGRLHPR